MKTLLILGAGTGGTIIANKMVHQLDLKTWRVIVVDRDETHYYQPGFLFIPFGVYTPDDVVKPKKHFLPQNVEVIFSDITQIEPAENRVTLGHAKRVINYDQLVIATGSEIHPEETEGLMEGGWRQNIFDFYTYDGSVALSHFLKTWQGGRLVLNVAEMPIKCPVAPLEFLFLADWYFRKHGRRHKVELVYATPLSGAFTKPRTSAVLSDLLVKKGIVVEPDFNIGEVDSQRQVIRSYDDRELNYDLLISVPTHMGADVIGHAKLGNELNFIPTDKHSLQSKAWKNIWVLGDATDLPTSKAGSVTHFMADVLTDNLSVSIRGGTPKASFDGHSNCFIESGDGKAFLIDFNYDVEPMPGTYPLPGIGPFSLLKETAINHWGKLAFRWIYWNVLLRGYKLPIGSQMSMVGKNTKVLA